VAVVTAHGNGRLLVRDREQQRLAYAIADGHRRWVFLDGRTYAVGAGGRGRGAESGSRPQDDAQALASPMPATVVGVKVKPCAHVSRGDVLVMLEAMKMELPIKAPRDGVVKAIGCREQPGIALVELV
jgi:acetyl/propionyl-CoA carboxylase alpha subunit